MDLKPLIESFKQINRLVTRLEKHNIKATLTYNSLEKSEKFPEIIKENDIEIVF